MTTKTLAKREAFSIVPGNLTEATQLAQMIAKSGLAPKDYVNKPDAVLVAIMMGGELGLAPMQALQNIAVINGRPCLWGDAVTALVYQHPDLEYVKEWFDNPDNPQVAYCEVKRKGHPAHTRQFSLKDAAKAGLLAKESPWKTYPSEMMKNRARKAFWDKFADILKGVYLREEVEDMEPQHAMKNITPEAISQGDKILEKIGDKLPPIEQLTEKIKSDPSHKEPTGDQTLTLPGGVKVNGFEVGESEVPFEEAPPLFDPEKDDGAKFYNVAREWIGDDVKAKEFIAFYLKERMPKLKSGLKAISPEDKYLLWVELQKMPKKEALFT